MRAAFGLTLGCAKGCKGSKITRPEEVLRIEPGILYWMRVPISPVDR